MISAIKMTGRDKKKSHKKDDKNRDLGWLFFDFRPKNVQDLKMKISVINKKVSRCSG